MNGGMVEQVRPWIMCPTTFLEGEVILPPPLEFALKNLRVENLETGGRRKTFFLPLLNLLRFFTIAEKLKADL